MSTDTEGQELWGLSLHTGVRHLSPRRPVCRGLGAWPRVGTRPLRGTRGGEGRGRASPVGRAGGRRGPRGGPASGRPIRLLPSAHEVSLSSPGAGRSFAVCGPSSWGGPCLSTTEPRAVVSLLVEGPCRAARVASGIPGVQSLGDRSKHFLSHDYESPHVTVVPGGQESVVQTRCSKFELLWEPRLRCRAGIPVSAQGARGHPQD